MAYARHCKLALAIFGKWANAIRPYGMGIVARMAYAHYGHTPGIEIGRIRSVILGRPQGMHVHKRIHPRSYRSYGGGTNIKNGQCLGR